VKTAGLAELASDDAPVRTPRFGGVGVECGLIRLESANSGTRSGCAEWGYLPAIEPEKFSEWNETDGTDCWRRGVDSSCGEVFPSPLRGLESSSTVTSGLISVLPTRDLFGRPDISLRYGQSRSATG